MTIPTFSLGKSTFTGENSEKGNESKYTNAEYEDVLGLPVVFA